jgi:hypothetical protein
MPLGLERAPANAPFEIGRGIELLHTTRPEIAGRGLEVTAPVPVHRLRWERPGAPGAIADARRSGWRVLAEPRRDRAGRVYTIELADQAGDATLVAVTGPHRGDVEAAVLHADRLPETAGRQFEIRILDDPALRLEMVWLRATDGGDDLYIPTRVGIATPAPTLLSGARAQAMVDAAAVRLHDLINRPNADLDALGA